MSAVQTALVFGGIPLLVVLIFTLAVFGPGEVRQPNRYRPGKPWNYPPVWYLPRPGAQAAGSAERRALAAHTPAAIESGEAPTPAAVGGASGEW